jgi:hypothetical protein
MVKSTHFGGLAVSQPVGKTREKAICLSLLVLAEGRFAPLADRWVWRVLSRHVVRSSALLTYARTSRRVRPFGLRMPSYLAVPLRAGDMRGEQGGVGRRLTCRQGNACREVSAGGVFNTDSRRLAAWRVVVRRQVTC